MGRARKTTVALAAIIVVMIVMMLTATLAGCARPVAPHQQQSHGTPTTMRAEGVEKSKFKNAWEKLKDIFKATSVAVALGPLEELVGVLQAELAKIDPASLNDDEKQFLSRLQDVQGCFADSVLLWTIESRSKDLDCDGIPVYQGGKAAADEIDEIVERYGLELIDDPEQDIRFIPRDTIRALWDKAFADTQRWIQPVLR